MLTGYRRFCKLCALALMLLDAQAMATWNFTSVGNVSLINIPILMQSGGSQLVVQTTFSTLLSYTYNFSWPENGSAPALTLSGTTFSRLSILYALVAYPIYGNIAYYGASNDILSVGQIGSDGAVHSIYNLTVNQSVSGAIVDPDYPLLYYVTQGEIGVVNITNPFLLNTISRIQGSFNLNTVNPLVQTGSRVIAKSLSVSPGSFFSVIDISSMSYYSIFPGNNRFYTAEFITVDPERRFLVIQNSIYGQLCLHGYEPPFPYYFCADVTSYYDAFFIGDYLVTSGFEVFKIVRANNSGMLQNYTYTRETVNVDSWPGAGYSFQAFWQRGLFFSAQQSPNRLVWYNVTTDSGLDIYSLTVNAPLASKSHKSVNPAPLFFSQNLSIVVDARNVQPLSRRHLYATDGKSKDFALHNVTYYVSSVNPASTNIEVYSNATQSWSVTSVFRQFEVDSANVRIIPAYSYLADCSSGTALPYTGNITFTVADAWNRNIGSTTVPFAVVCCSNSSMTVGEDANYDAVAQNLQSGLSYCSWASPGYYIDSSLGAAKPCPKRTYNPFVTRNLMRDACFSCPSGAITQSSASKSWTDCNCPSCYLGVNANFSVLPGVSQAHYYYQPSNWIQNPHKDRPILFKYGFKGAANNYISFSPNSTNLNGSAPASTFLPQVIRLRMAGYSLYSGFSMNSTFSYLNFNNSESFGDINAYTDVWVFYWKGFMVSGLVPISYNTKTGFTFRDRVLPFLLSGNLSFPDTTVWTTTHIFANYTNPDVAIRDIGLGGYGTSTSYYRDAYVVDVDGYVDDYDLTQISGPFLLDRYEIMTKAPEQTFYKMPSNLWSVNWTILQNSAAVTWLNSSDNSFDFSASLDTQFGQYAVFVVNNGSINASSWPQVTEFSQQQLDNSSVFLRVTNNSALFTPGLSFGLPFTVLNSLVSLPVGKVYNFALQIPLNYLYGCPSGQEINSTFNGCSGCAADTYQDSWGAFCKPCPLGSTTYSAVSAASIYNCTAKPSFMVVNQVSYTFGCPAGQGLTANLSYCETCAAEYFQEAASYSACSPCGANRTTFGTLGSTLCWDSTAYVYSNGAIVCAQGFYQSGNGCIACPVDTFKNSTGNETCTTCPKNFGTNNKQGSKDALACELLGASVNSAKNSQSSVSSVAVILGSVGGFLVLVAAAAVVLVYRKRLQKTKTSPTMSPSARNSFRASIGSTATGYLTASDTTTTAASVSFQRTIPTLTSQSRTASYLMGAPGLTRTITMATNTRLNSTGSLMIAFPGFLLIDSGTGYRTEKKIAEGGFAKLYTGVLLDTSVIPSQCKDSFTSIQNRVAIKVFDPPSCKTREALDEQLDDLENEVTIMHALAVLPNVAMLLAVSREPQRAIIMKLYECSVDNFLHDPKNKLTSLALQFCQNSWIQVAAYLNKDVLTGVSSMHEMKVCHLDLKPRNFLLERTNRPNGFPLLLVITDFGLARASSDLQACQKMKQRFSTGISLPYASPEAFNIVRFLDKKIDVQRTAFTAMDAYSTAVSLWEIMSRKSPFSGLGAEEVEARITQGLKPSLLSLPLPENPVEANIMAVTSHVIESGWMTNANARQPVGYLYKYFISNINFS